MTKMMSCIREGSRSHERPHFIWCSETGKERKKGKECYFNVDPALVAKSVTGPGKSDPPQSPLPLDGLVVLTVISKWMGPISKWRSYFEEASVRGYNMLHFTPLQQRGQSSYGNQQYSRSMHGSYER